MVPNSTLMIGDIIASGETLVQCLRYVTDYYRKQGAKLRNILLFTIGGTQGIEILEKLTKEIRTYWPDFEGFITVYYEGVFSCYEEGDKGVSGINRALIDFYWKGGIVAPEFRRQTLSMQNPLFEKCTIYDGGARRTKSTSTLKRCWNSGTAFSRVPTRSTSRRCWRKSWVMRCRFPMGTG